MVGMFWAFLCAGYGMMVFYHDYITTLLSVSASACLLAALNKDNRRLMLLAGVIVGADVFVRLPNLSLSLLILTLIPYYIYNRDGHNTLVMAGYVVVGFLIGVGIIVGLMAASGYLGIFINSMEDGFSAASDGGSTHNLSAMFSVYLHDYAAVLFNMVCIALYVHEGDFLLCFQNIPTLHYLTNTRPYLKNP